MNHTLLRRIFLLETPDERAQEHERRSANYALIVSAWIALILLEYRLLVQHTVSLDLIILIYVLGLTKIGFRLWYRARY